MDIDEAAPVVFKRKTNKGAQRARTIRTDDADDASSLSSNVTSINNADVNDNSATSLGAESPSTLASKLKKKTRKPPVASRLSFGGGPGEDGEEGGEEEVKVVKSRLSRKVGLGMGKAAPTSNLSSSFDQQANFDISSASSGPVYDTAYLSQLKASHASRPQVDNDTLDGYTMDVDTSNLPISTAGRNYDTDIDGMDTSETAIPSASSIAAAKEKRTRIRKIPGAGMDEDFISLSLTRKEDNVPAGPHPDSRLVREEDELGEGDDEFAEYTSAQERIALGKKSRKKEASKRREEMAELIADAVEDVDEEEAEWEQEQLRRGGHAVLPSSAESKPVYKPAPIPDPTPIPTLSPAIARLTTSLTQLTTSHATSTATLSALAQERLALETRETELRTAVEQAEEKRAWFDAFREWVEGVAVFLDEKFPHLEKLENEHISLLRERGEMIVKRRRMDDEDDLATFLGSLPRTVTHDEDEAMEVDELGRERNPDPVLQRPERRAARTARHARRVQVAKGKALPRSVSMSTTTAASIEEEGYSSDGSLDSSDAQDLVFALASVAERATDVLSDVQAKDFRDPAVGVGRWFGEWRKRYEEIYVGAWGGLGAVGAWEFWVRWELMGGERRAKKKDDEGKDDGSRNEPWNPLEAGASTMDNMEWFGKLYAYSRPNTVRERIAEDDDDDEGELGPEGDLAAAMVGTAVIPRVVTMVDAGAFDPYSARNVRKLVDFGEQVEIAVERSGPKFQMFLKAVFSVFEAEVVALEERVKPFLRLNQPRFDPAAIPARRRVLVRMAKLADCILLWRKFSEELFGIGRLVSRLLELEMRVGETGWEVGGEEIVRKVVSKVPAELVPNSVKARLV